MATSKTKTRRDDVAAAQANATGGAYAARYQFDVSTGQPVPMNPDAMPQALAHIRVEQHGKKLTAYIPTLAVGSARALTGAQTWDPINFANWEPLDFNTDGRRDLRWAVKWWKKDPLVFRCVKVLTQLANSDFTISCEDEPFKDIIDTWVSVALSYTLRKAFFTEYFRTGMVPIMKTLIPYVPRNYKSNKIPKPNDAGNVDSRALATQQILDRNSQTLGKVRTALGQLQRAEQMGASEDILAEYRRVVAARQHEWTMGMIPGSYTVLDPLCIEIKGPENMAWLRQPYMTVSGDLYAAIKDPKPEQLPTIEQMPQEIVQQIKAGSKEIWLPANICRIVYGDKQPYERYPTPMASHAFEALEMKYALKDMDEATAKSVRNRILKVTIGNDTFPEFDEAKLLRLAGIFNSPNRNLTLFWNHTLELEWIEPNLDCLKDHEKYNIWNDEVRTAYGISPILTGTSATAGAVGNSVLNFKSVEEEVTEAQEAFLEWFHEELRMLKAALGVSHEVKGTFDRLNLKDEIKMMAVLNQLVMNGIIDEQTALETMKFHFPTIQARMEKMQKLHKKGMFMPRPSANNLGPGGTLMPQKTGQGTTKSGGGTPTGGKPANQPLADNNANKKGTSQPKLAKAAARLIPLSVNEAVLVIDGSDLDPEFIRDVAETFQIPNDWILTSAQYEEKYGHKPDLAPAWPELEDTELMSVVRNSVKVTAAIEAAAKQAEEDFKQEHKGGKRNAYITAKVREDLLERATAQVLAPYCPADVDDAAWLRRVDQAMGQAIAAEHSPLEARVVATLVCKRRFEKALVG